MKTDDLELGLDSSITRRDFLNSAVLGTGAALLAQAAPAAVQSEAAAFDGYSGVGDYAHANGNTWDVLSDAHSLRDGAFRDLKEVTDTGELYDVVVIGGGFAGIGAAHRAQQLHGGRKTCLVLENHRMWGGEARRNEFQVDGVRLYAPQGSNECAIGKKDLAGTLKGQLWDELALPREFNYAKLPASRKPLAASHSNYVFHLWGDNFASHGFWLPEQKRWVTNPWAHGLAGMPWSENLKRDLLRWRNGLEKYPAPEGREMERWLDTMSYEQFLTNVAGLSPEVARFADPILAAAGGLGSDATSAVMAWRFNMPGFQGMQPDHPAHINYALGPPNSEVQRFPGGNDALMRAFIKRLVPDAIAGGNEFAAIHNSPIKLEALDRPGQQTRIRLSSTTVAVEHVGARDKAERVAITYLRNGRLHRVHARGVVVASGSWPAKHFVRDLPDNYREAMGRFYRSPMLCINVALKNWQPLYKLGYTAASWRGGLGFAFNLSPPMHVGHYAPAFDPDKPVVLTYYVPYIKPGLPVEQQGPVARAELLATPYRDIERSVRIQLTEMLSAQGFNARRDIAGVILNRWGHAYVDPYPGFYYGQNGKPAPVEVLRNPLGRVAFGHSEFRGHQNWSGAIGEGRRAMEQILNT